MNLKVVTGDDPGLSRKIVHAVIRVLVRVGAGGRRDTHRQGGEAAEGRRRVWTDASSYQRLEEAKASSPRAAWAVHLLTP